MVRRRIAGALSIAFGMIALTLALSAGSAQAQAPDQTGWWFELQTKSLPAPLPNPPAVPDGGIFVQQGPQGPVAYGAVQAHLSNAQSAILTLTVAQGSTTAVPASLRACATTAAWQAPQSEPGAWEDAPAYTDPCTLGAISSDGKYVAFFFGGPFLTSGALDVAIAPVDKSNPFAIAFDKPADDSLAVTAGSAVKPPIAGPATPAPSGTSAITPSGPVVASPAIAPSPAVTPTTAAADLDTRSPVADAVLSAAGFGDPDRGARAAALAGASALVIGWWLLSTRTAPMPRLLGALAGAGADADRQSALASPVGGIGRFRRAREGDARSLR